MNLFTFVCEIKNCQMLKHFLFFLVLFGLTFTSLKAQSPCSSEAHHQFDFWLGDWAVYHATADTIVGHNKIESILNGCVIQENWTGATGFSGKSLNTFNPIDSTWNQVWVDVSGATYHFKGKLIEGAMVMNGATTYKGKPILFEMSYTPDINTGHVRQIWKQSSDEGETWAVVFDGIYKKQKS